MNPHKFVCTSCCKTKDDKEIEWWENKPTCQKCFKAKLAYAILHLHPVKYK